MAARRGGSTARRARASARARARRAAPRPARPASWVTSAKVRSSARKSGKRSVASASTHDAEVDVGEVVALGHHLRADEDAAPARARSAASTRAGSPTSASRRNTGPAVELGLEALGPRPVAGDRDRAAARAARRARARGGRSGGRPAGRRARCMHERDVARRAPPRLPARAAGQEVRPAAAVEQHDRLARVGERLVGARVQRAPRLAHVDDLDRRQRRAVDARGQAQARQRVDALGPRRRAAGDEHGAGRARRGARRRGARRSAGRPRACRRRRAPRRRRPARRPRIGAKTAERGPTQTRASPRRSRAHSSWRSPSESLECSTATVSPKRSTKRATICGVSAISGTSTITPRPAASVSAAALQVDLGLARAGDAVQQQPLARAARARSRAARPPGRP